MDETRKIAAAKGLAHGALQNVMPRYLLALADQLGTQPPDAGTEERRRKHFQNHISTRIRQGYHLAEMLHEFVTLGRCIAKMWAELLASEWPASADIGRLHDAIQTAITSATDTFHRHMLEDEQTEKRYLRRLQSIASAGLHDVPLRDRMREMLEVIMEAMGAQCAAYLCYSVAKGELVLVASAGAEVLEPYASSLDPKSFVARIAADEEPTQMFDAKATALEVPQTLADSGIHALLGVRLPTKQDLRGVVYVGMSEARTFSSREVRRIESLGEWLALHLENAQLFAELREKIDALHVERALRERFVAILAHDLRGPLASARLAAEMMRNRPPDLRPLVAKVESNLDRIDRMTRDLLDANRIRAGEPLPLRLEECDLGTLASHVVEEARAQHGDRFILECAAPVRGVWSADELHRTLWNLVTNAVKYGTKKPIKIVVTRTGVLARITVHNEGPPIPAHDVPQIFDAYARTLAAQRSESAGWGLGLTLVRGSVEAHGGNVTVASDAATGTTFTIELPLDARPFQPHEPGPPTVH